MVTNAERCGQFQSARVEVEVDIKVGELEVSS